MPKVYKEHKLTGKRTSIGTDSYYLAKQIYDAVQKNDNANNDFLVWIE